LLLYRHHILDVVAGIFLGFFEGFVVFLIWFGPKASENLIKWISDDRISGNDAEII
jgi:membrane-associated phospholipid phosphatase